MSNIPSKVCESVCLLQCSTGTRPLLLTGSGIMHCKIHVHDLFAPLNHSTNLNVRCLYKVTLHKDKRTKTAHHMPVQVQQLPTAGAVGL